MQAGTGSVNGQGNVVPGAVIHAGIGDHKAALHLKTYFTDLGGLTTGGVLKFEIKPCTIGINAIGKQRSTGGWWSSAL